MLITFKEAAKEIDRSITVFSAKNSKYKDFIEVQDGRKMFNIVKYNKHKEYKDLVLARVTLFIEYAVHEKGIIYNKMSKISDVSCAGLFTHDIGYENAIKLVSGMAKNRPFLARDFCRFYGYKKIKIGV